jgi:hypothetical protein
MKRVLIFILVMFLHLAFLFGAEKRFMFTINGNYISNADSNYSELYGKKKFFPEGKIAVKVKGNIYLWGSCGFFSGRYNWVEWSNKGVIEADLEGKSDSDKLVISGGIGYYVGYFEKNQISMKFETGICSIANSIKSTLNQMDTKGIIRSAETKQSGIGVRGNFGIAYGFYKNLFSEVSVGYLYAGDKVGTDAKRINLGGFRLSVGLGLTF